MLRKQKVPKERKMNYLSVFLNFKWQKKSIRAKAKRPTSSMMFSQVHMKYLLIDLKPR